MPALPPWLRSELIAKKDGGIVAPLLKEMELNTVCVSAKCPNRGYCFNQKTATFMILGDVCTRNCGFCAVSSGQPQPVDVHEVTRIVEAVKRLDLKHVVITSVTRDDLPDQGVGQFARAVTVLRELAEQPTIEILTPDFSADEELLAAIATLPIDVFNHNLETVPRLYEMVRPQADYQRSLHVLRRIKELAPQLITKSGIMVGFGERAAEVLTVLEDMRRNGVEMVTIGQYLRPTRSHLEIHEYITPERFKAYAEYAEGLGFTKVASAPLVRSSYLAESLLKNDQTGAVHQ